MVYKAHATYHVRVSTRIIPTTGLCGTQSVRKNNAAGMSFNFPSSMTLAWPTTVIRSVSMSDISVSRFICRFHHLIRATLGKHRRRNKIEDRVTDLLDFSILITCSKCYGWTTSIDSAETVKVPASVISGEKCFVSRS